MLSNKLMGRNFFGILNDLKRDFSTAACELGIDTSLLQRYIDGREEIPHELIVKASQIWPVNIRDFYVFEDDARSGALIMTNEQSERSSRVLDRGGRPYYEYRDTAMSRTSLFRPEWIKELLVVDNNDPNSEELCWNNGHFLHQFTYFIGPVNFYYEHGGKRFCVQTNTGDSMYITPYIPHTFATRKNEARELGVILALTYGVRLMGDAQQELAVLGLNSASDFLINYSDGGASGSLIRFFREQLSMPLDILAKKVGLSLKYMQSIEDGRDIIPTVDELRSVAKVLGVSVRDLMPVVSSDPVINLSYEQARRWNYPDESGLYTFVELASTPKLPYSKGLEVTVRPGATSSLKTLGHQYIYNIGESRVGLSWESSYDRQVEYEYIYPRDSVYMKPCVKHRFISDNGIGRLLVMRIGGRLSGDTQHELSLLDRSGLERVCGELVPWYNKEGKH